MEEHYGIRPSQMEYLGFQDPKTTFPQTLARFPPIDDRSPGTEISSSPMKAMVMVLACQFSLDLKMATF